MDAAIVGILVAGLSSLLGALLSFIIEYRFFAPSRSAQKSDALTYRAKMQKLSQDLAHASAEVDKTLQEMTAVSQVREQVLKSLDEKLGDLTKREQEMQDRINALQSVSMPAVEHFLKMTERGEKRSALRDYMLFGAGVIVSTVIAVILKLIFDI